jgi:hypothetical protein
MRLAAVFDTKNTKDTKDTKVLALDERRIPREALIWFVFFVSK